MVVYATGITLCELLLLEGGVIIKWSDFVLGAGGGNYRWIRQDFEPGIDANVARLVTTSVNRFQTLIFKPGAIIATIFDQPEDEQLITEGFTDSPIILGNWGVPDPIDGFGYEMFAREADALSEFPDALPWVF